MNARERLFAALNGEPTDHVPIWLLFPYHRTSYYADVRNEPSYRPVFEASKQYAIMLDRRNLHVSLFAPEVQQRRAVWSEGEERIERDLLEYRGRRLYAEVRRRRGNTEVKRLLCTADDLEFYCSLPLNTDPDVITAQLDAQLPNYLQERAEFPPAYGAMMLDLGEPVGPLYHAARLEEYAIWSLTHADLIAAWFDRVMGQKRLVYQYCLDRKLAEVYFLVGSELASPPLVSRRTFRRWIVPYAGELIELIHRYGCYVIQHYHGQIKLILPDFLEMGPDGLHTIEAPPIGNCTFTEAFAVVGDRIVLIGNIQYDDFRALTPDEMRQAVITVLDECRGKRLILSPSAGPYEERITPEMAENYIAFMKTAWEYDVSRET